MTADRHTTEQAPGKPLSAPLAASTPEVGVSGGSDPLTEPQAGAQPRGPVDWARHYANQRATIAPATANHPLVKGRCPACRGASLFLGSGGYVTCARLDCPDPCAADKLLHGEQDAPAPAATEGCTPACHGATGIRGLLEHVGIDTTGRDITVAGRLVDPAPAHNAGPSIRECAANDRAHWDAKYAGEGQ